MSHDLYRYDVPSLTDCSLLGTWTLLSATTPFAFLEPAVMIFPNTDDAQLMQFGTKLFSYPVVPSNGSWQNITPSLLSDSHPPRFADVACWLPTRSTVFLFGGLDAFFSPPAVWEWSPDARLWVEHNQNPVFDGIAGAGLAC